MQRWLIPSHCVIIVYEMFVFWIALAEISSEAWSWHFTLCLFSVCSGEPWKQKKWRMVQPPALTTIFLLDCWSRDTFLNVSFQEKKVPSTFKNFGSQGRNRVHMKYLSYTICLKSRWRHYDSRPSVVCWRCQS